MVSVVAHRSLTPDLWDVTLEKSQDSSHDVVSIICRKHGNNKHPIKYIIFFSLLFYVQLFVLLSDLLNAEKDSASPCSSKPLHQVACLTASALKGSFGVAMAVHVDWWVEYPDHSKPVFPSRAAVSTFSFTDHQIFGIAPITEVLNSSHFRVLKLRMRVFEM